MIDYSSILPKWKILSAIESFLSEDIPYWDISSIVFPDTVVRGAILIKQETIFAGITIAESIFQYLNCKTKVKYLDGQKPEKIPDIVMEIEGKAYNLFIGERLSLNILGRLSAIATETNKAKIIVEEVNLDKKISPKICATRKTTPGLRIFEKYAVMVGGGDSHRLSLSDAVMLKDNHLKLFDSISDAINKIKGVTSFVHKIEVEVENIESAIEAAKAGADIIMLDNFNPDLVDNTVDKIRSINRKILIEASGGITQENLKHYAKTKVDLISMGSITHSVRNIDFSLELID